MTHRPIGHIGTNKIMKNIGVTTIITLMLIVVGCREKTAPKPTAYPFIENRATEYTPHNIKTYPLQFNIANNAITESNNKNNKWLNIKYPDYNATIYCTYINSDSNKIQTEIAKSRELVYIHAKLATEINTLSYSDTTKNTTAELYILKGNVATPLQFVATDQSTYIFRGSLYFNAQVNNDSVAPIVEYLKNDIYQIIETITPQ